MGVRQGLDGADCENAFMGFTYLDQASLIGAHLKGVNFFGSSLDGTDFTGAHMVGVKMDTASLDEETKLEGADLTNAILPAAYPFRR